MFERHTGIFEGNLDVSVPARDSMLGASCFRRLSTDGHGCCSSSSSHLSEDRPGEDSKAVAQA